MRITERCRCGATVDVEDHAPTSWAEEWVTEWRKAHCHAWRDPNIPVIIPAPPVTYPTLWETITGRHR